MLKLVVEHCNLIFIYLIPPCRDITNWGYSYNIFLYWSFSLLNISEFLKALCKYYLIFLNSSDRNISPSSKNHTELRWNGPRRLNTILKANKSKFKVTSHDYENLGLLENFSVALQLPRNFFSLFHQRNQKIIIYDNT